MPHQYDWLFGRIVELDMTGHGPPWPVAVFNPETKAFEAVSVERNDGEMRWQGTFRPDSTYYVGDVVRTDTGTYVCTQRPTPVQETKADTFTRADQDGWGTASDGEEWVPLNPPQVPATTTIASNQGLSSVNSAFGWDQYLLGAPLASANADMLVRWSVAVAGGSNDGVLVDLSDAPVRAVITIDGAYRLTVQAEYTSSPTWAGASVGDLLWTRFRQDRGVIQIRTWADGTTEPTSWDAEWDSGNLYPSGGFVSIYNALNNASSTVSFDSLSVAMLHRELASPGVATDHWDRLAS